MKSCLLCGIGGQGTVLSSRIIAEAAMSKGLFARTAETIGMAQRGGSVVSHVRFGDYIPSPLISSGEADVLLGFEPGEALRNITALKKNGLVIAAKQVLQPVTATLAKSNYNSEDVIKELKRVSPHLILVDTEKVIQACGSPKVINVALLQSLAETGVLDLTIDDIITAMKCRIKPKFYDMNLKALSIAKGEIIK